MYTLNKIQNNSDIIFSAEHFFMKKKIDLVKLSNHLEKTQNA